MRRAARQHSFADRADAGRKLAAALGAYKTKPCVVLALPRGGVAVAAEVALSLPAPLDLLLVRKIGAPMQPELALGAVVDGANPIVVRNDDVIALTGTSEEEFARICAREQTELERRRRRYLPGGPSPDVSGKAAIVIDDGIATGATMRAALKAVRLRAPSHVVLAVPVAPPDSIASLRAATDDVVCLEMPDDFLALGFYYRDFRQLGDEDVVNILKYVRSAD
jgi:predicted phosphoribosyltransferase